MKPLLILPLLVFLVFFIGNFAFAEPIENMEKGVNYDRKYLGIDDQGNPLYEWTSKPERILINGEFENYKIKNEPTYLRFESANMAVQFNKQTCTMRLYDAGDVNTNEPPILNSVSMTIKEAEFGFDLWIDHEINTMDCNFDYTASEEGIQVILSKNSEMVGFGNLMETIYDIHYGGEIKTTFKYRNGDVVKFNHKYGFTQNFNGPFIVQIGDISYDLTSISKEITFSIKDIEGKTIKIKKNGSEITYDPQNYIHQYLWAVKLKNNHVTFDFTNAEKPLPVGETLEIDPTYGYTAGTIYLVKMGLATGSRCDTSSYALESDTFAVWKVDTSDNSNPSCRATGTQFDTTSIPDGASITNSSLQIKVSVQANQQQIDITQITHNLAASNAETILNDLNNTSNGTSYVSSSSCCTSTGTKNVDLGATADTDIASGLANNRFAIGIRDTDWARDPVQTRYFRVSAIELGVTYTIPPPNPPNGLSCTSVGRQMHCSWNPSIPTSGSQNGVNNYYIGKSLNNSTFTNKTSVANVTSTIMYSYFGANKLYYFNVTSNNGVNSTTSAHTSVTTDNFPSIPTSTSANGVTSSKIIIRWNAPTSNGNDPISGYKIDYCITCTSWTNLVNSTNTYNYNHTGLGNPITVKYRMAAWNAVGLSPFTANFTGQTIQSTTAIVPMNTTMVGDAFGVTPKLRMTAGSLAATITSSQLYRNGTLIDTDTYSQSISNGETKTFSNQYTNLLNRNFIYNHTVVITITNGTGTTQTFKNSTYERPDYTADYYTMNGYLVNYTHFRTDDGSGLNFTVNRDPITFHLRCQLKTQLFEDGGEVEGNNLAYFNTQQEVPATQNVYVKCYNDALIIDFVSYGQFNGTLAILDYSEELGTFFGVPIIFMPIIFFAALFTGVSAPRGAIFLVAVIGIMGVMGFFPDDTGDPLITGATWSLLIFLAVVGLFLGKRFS